MLSGRLRLVLGEQDFTMASGEAAEFDTRVPHWLGSAGDGPVEALVLFGRQGDTCHLRARSRTPADSGSAWAAWTRRDQRLRT